MFKKSACFIGIFFILLCFKSPVLHAQENILVTNENMKDIAPDTFAWSDIDKLRDEGAVLINVAPIQSILVKDLSNTGAATSSSSSSSSSADLRKSTDFMQRRYTIEEAEKANLLSKSREFLSSIAAKVTHLATVSEPAKFVSAFYELGSDTMKLNYKYSTALGNQYNFQIKTEISDDYLTQHRMKALFNSDAPHMFQIGVRDYIMYPNGTYEMTEEEIKSIQNFQARQLVVEGPIDVDGSLLSDFLNKNNELLLMIPDSKTFSFVLAGVLRERLDLDAEFFKGALNNNISLKVSEREFLKAKINEFIVERYAKIQDLIKANVVSTLVDDGSPYLNSPHDVDRKSQHGALHLWRNHDDVLDEIKNRIGFSKLMAEGKLSEAFNSLDIEIKKRDAENSAIIENETQRVEALIQNLQSAEQVFGVVLSPEEEQ